MVNRGWLKWVNSSYHELASNYMFKVNNRNTRSRCEIFSNLTIKTKEFFALVFVSQERGMTCDQNKNKKTMLLVQNAILLLKSKQNTWCLSQFGTISFIKTLKTWWGDVRKCKTHHRFKHKITDTLFLVSIQFILIFVFIIWVTYLSKIRGTIVISIAIVVSYPFSVVFSFFTWRCRHDIIF